MDAGGGPLVDIAAHETKAIANVDRPSFSAEDLRQGRVLLFVDALDEVPDNHARQTVIDKITAFSTSYPACKVVVTSRPYPFLQTLFDLAGFSRFDLAAFSYRQAEQILRRLHHKRRLPKEASEEVLRRLEQVHGVEINPLLVTVFAATTDFARRDIPANITELFKKFTEIMLLPLA